MAMTPPSRWMARSQRSWIMRTIAARLRSAFSLLSSPFAHAGEWPTPALTATALPFSAKVFFGCHCLLLCRSVPSPCPRRLAPPYPQLHTAPQATAGCHRQGMATTRAHRHNPPRVTICLGSNRWSELHCFRSEDRYDDRACRTSAVAPPNRDVARTDTGRGRDDGQQVGGDRRGQVRHGGGCPGGYKAVVVDPEPRAAPRRVGRVEDQRHQCVPGSVAVRSPVMSTESNDSRGCRRRRRLADGVALIRIEERTFLQAYSQCAASAGASRELPEPFF